jgi:nitric oxide synthase oxygenase domain/subunit
MLGWRGAGVTFEVVPVVKSQEMREIVEPLL